jgi:hypothetical protein
MAESTDAHDLWPVIKTGLGNVNTLVAKFQNTKNFFGKFYTKEEVQAIFFPKGSFTTSCTNTANLLTLNYNGSIANTPLPNYKDLGKYLTENRDRLVTIYLLITNPGDTGKPVYAGDHALCVYMNTTGQIRLIQSFQDKYTVMTWMDKNLETSRWTLSNLEKFVNDLFTVKPEEHDKINQILNVFVLDPIDWGTKSGIKSPQILISK